MDRTAGMVKKSVLALSLFAGSTAMAQVEGQTDGPDVIVGDLSGYSRYTQFNHPQRGLIHPFAIGTTSCNVGDELLPWWTTSNTSNPALFNQHPVIAQNLYRYKQVPVVVDGVNLGNAGQFECIGISWLKHGFTALSQSLCNPCQNPDNTGGTLDPGCSDPYVSSLNGTQSRLGPRYQVNPYTAAYPYPVNPPPPAVPSGGEGSIYRRLQVLNDDLVPAQNVGAMYFGEGQYVAPGDATYFINGVSNGVNNASYRRATVLSISGGGFQLNNAIGSTTQRRKSAIHAWKDVADPQVQIVTVDVPDEGRLEVGYRVTPLADGWYAYEYAIRNHNSDRAVGSFSIPLVSEACTRVENIGMRDVFYHSGEPYSDADWTMTKSNAVSWSTESHAANANANAIRWGTMYTFRFVAKRPPMSGTATIGLFKPGTPETLPVAVAVPSGPEVDFNNDTLTPDNADIEAYFTVFGGGACPTASCDSIDFNGDGLYPDNADLEAFLRVFGGGSC